VSDFIYEQLEEAIILKEFLSNEQLPSERELSTLFNCSRLALREALAALEQQGLIEKRLGAKGGTFVLPTTKRSNHRSSSEIKSSWKDLMDIFEYRSIIEPEAARLAALRISDEELDSLQLILDQSQHQLIEREEFRSLDVKFHLLIGRASGNTYLESAIRKIRTRINPALDLMPYSNEVKTKTITDHKHLLAALHERNSTLTKEMMVNHIHGSTEAISNQFSKHSITNDET
jgi:GntR family transcriptional regulator, transcriptional repressor for pyruvate dehydrogenase complex